MRKIVTTAAMIFIWLFCASVTMAQLPGSLDLSFGTDGKVTTDFWEGDDYRRIVDGVDTIWSPGIPGPISSLSNTTVAIASGENTASSPSLFALANKVGKGRVIALGHDGLVEDHGISYFDNLTFVTNSIEWLDHLGRKKVVITTGHNEWAKGTNTLTIQQQLTGKGYAIDIFSGRLTKQMLQDVGVVFIGIAWEEFTQDELAALEEFLQQGGSLFLVGLGWSWEPYHPGKTLDDYPMNIIGAFSGVRWIGGAIVDPQHQYLDSPLFLSFYSEFPGQNRNDEGHSVAVQPDGKIVVAGSSGGNFALARYNSNGALDPGFGTGGRVLTDLGGTDEGRSVAVQPDGKIVVAGSSGGNFALARYNSNGALDPGFGTGGSVITDFGYGNDAAHSLVLQPDGKIVVAGVASNGNNADFALARYNSNGSLDPGFGNGGKVLTDFPDYVVNFRSNDVGHSVTLQPDGKIIVAGQAQGQYSDRQFALARYNPDGALDNSFGNNGRVVTHLGDFVSVVNSVALQPDGKIVAAGYAETVFQYGFYVFALVRYNADGNPDSTFGYNGRVLTSIREFSPFRILSSYAYSMVIQPDGKIIAGGYCLNADHGTDFALSRYYSNGSLDNTFGSGGKVITNFGYNIGRSVALQADGKIVVAGGSDGDFALVRYYGGSLPGIGNEGYVHALATNGSGVYAGGDFLNAGGNPNADRIARWDGTYWHALGNGLNNWVRALAVSGTDLYAGGWFSDAGGNPGADCIARWEGQSWQALGGGVNGAVYAIAVSASSVYVGGCFSKTGDGQIVNQIARWDGQKWNKLGDGLMGIVSAIAVKGSEVYAAGSFQDAGGDPNADYVACWDGQKWKAVGSGLNGTVYSVSALAVKGNDLYAGGFFTNVNGNPDADYVVRWDGQSWLSLGTSVWGSVKALAVNGNNVYVGGYFRNQGGNPDADYVACWDGQSWQAVGTGTSEGVNALAVGQNTLYAGGYFTEANGLPALGFAWWPLEIGSENILSDVTGGVEEVKANEYGLDQNYPNPFNPTTTIRYSLKQAGRAKLAVYDVLGRLVLARDLEGQAGWNTYQLDGSRLSSGAYFYRLVAGNYAKTMKMLLLK